jgi:hypothetical protein
MVTLTNQLTNTLIEDIIIIVDSQINDKAIKLDSIRALLHNG